MEDLLEYIDKLPDLIDTANREYKQRERTIKQLQDRRGGGSSDTTGSYELEKDGKQLKKLTKELEKERKESSDMKKKMEKLKSMYKEKDEECELYRNELAKLQNQLLLIEESKSGKTDHTQSRYGRKENDLILKLERTKSDLYETKQELDETKTRLSRMMGNKLTDSNPHIADLSDKNRPTKLAERFGELYDNLWTDAYETLDKSDERETVSKLLNILIHSMAFCKKRSAEQLLDLKHVLTGAHKGSSLPSMASKQLKDVRKEVAESSLENLYQEYLSELRNSSSPNARDALKVPAYMKECFAICWLMCIQDPPVVIATKVTRGDAFDHNVLKAYTQSGPSVDFLVWPPLMLCDNGTVLCKGVAQGCSAAPSKQGMPSTADPLSRDNRHSNYREYADLDRDFDARSDNYKTYGTHGRRSRETSPDRYTSNRMRSSNSPDRYDRASTAAIMKSTDRHNARDSSPDRYHDIYAHTTTPDATRSRSRSPNAYRTRSSHSPERFDGRSSTTSILKKADRHTVSAHQAIDDDIVTRDYTSSSKRRPVSASPYAGAYQQTTPSTLNSGSTTEVPSTEELEKFLRFRKMYGVESPKVKDAVGTRSYIRCINYISST